MKKVVAIIGMGLLSSSFGLDEYLSIEAGKVELDAGYGYVGGTGTYDDDGEKQQKRSAQRDRHRHGGSVLR